jgi:hypothetical protein
VAHRFTDEDDALLEELGIEVEAKKETGRTAREERVIAGFEEIQRFVDQHRQPPQHGEDRDMFERLYAARLDRLLELPDCRALLEPLDRQGLLTGAAAKPVAVADDLDDNALLAELGVDTTKDSIAELKHVRSAADKRAAEEIANRTKCEDFDRFKPLFEKVQREIESGVRQSRPFVKDAGFLKADIVRGHFFILGGLRLPLSSSRSPERDRCSPAKARMVTLQAARSTFFAASLIIRALRRTGTSCIRSVSPGAT